MAGKKKGIYYLNKNPWTNYQRVDVESAFTEPIHRAQEKKEFSELVANEVSKIRKMTFIQKNSYLTNQINQLRQPKTDADAYSLTILIEALKRLNLEPELVLLLKYTPRK